MTDEECVMMSNDVIDLIAERLDGEPIGEVIVIIQCLIGTLYEVMKGNIGESRALMALCRVIEKAAKEASPDSGIQVQLIPVRESKAKH